MNKQMVDMFFDACRIGSFDTMFLRAFARENIIAPGETPLFPEANPPYTWDAFLKEAGIHHGPFASWTWENYVFRCQYCEDWEWVAFAGEAANCKYCHVSFCHECEEYYLISAHHELVHAINDGVSVSQHSAANPPGTHSPDGLIKSYNEKIDPIIHGMPVVTLSGEFITPTYGIELEVERAPGWPASLHADILKCLTKNYAMLKRDGSLSNNGQSGFEIVAAPATFDWLMSESAPWTKFFRDFTQFLAYDPGTTGLHIHIGSKSLTSLEIAKLAKFINEKTNLPFLEWVSERTLNNNVYTLLRPERELTFVLKKRHTADCQVLRSGRNGNGPVKHDGSDPWRNPIIISIGPSFKSISRCTCKYNKYGSPADHHDAFNFQTNLPTVEIRIFKGKMDADFFFSCIEFTDALVNFVKSKHKKEMTWADFLLWFDSTMPRKYRKFNKRLKMARNTGVLETIRRDSMAIVENPMAGKVAWHVPTPPPSELIDSMLSDMVAQPYWNNVPAQNQSTHTITFNIEEN